MNTSPLGPSSKEIDVGTLVTALVFMVVILFLMYLGKRGEVKALRRWLDTDRAQYEMSRNRWRDEQIESNRVIASRDQTIDQLNDLIKELTNA